MSPCVIKHRAKKAYGGIQTQLHTLEIPIYIQVIVSFKLRPPPPAVSLFPVKRRVVPAEHEAGWAHSRSEHPTFSTLGQITDYLRQFIATTDDHFPSLFRRACGRSDVWTTLALQTCRKGHDRTVVG